MAEDDFDDIRDEDHNKGGLLGDSLRKALITGMSAVLMTEEGIRNALSEMRLPKDALAYLAQQTERTRRELLRSVAEEIKGFLKSIDLTGELRKALTGLKVQVKAEIRFAEEGAVQTDVQTNTADADTGSEPEDAEPHVSSSHNL